MRNLMTSLVALATALTPVTAPLAGTAEDIQAARAAAPARVAADGPQVSRVFVAEAAAVEPMGPETRTALSAGRYRAAPSTASDTVGWISPGDAVVVVGKVRGQPWYQALRNGKRVFVGMSIVATTPPSVAAAPAASAPAAAAVSVGPPSAAAVLEALRAVAPPSPAALAALPVVGPRAAATGAAPVEAPREVPVDLSSGQGADFTREAQRVLEQLRVNQAPAKAPERPTALGSSAVETVNLSIGGARTVSLPGAFDKAVVVLPDVADVVVLGPGKAQIVARTAGSTDVVFSDPEGHVFKAHVIVGVDVSPLQQALNAALPGERITATAMNGSVYLSGTTRDATAAATAKAIAERFAPASQSGSNVINQIQVLGGQQVMLQVRVAEVRRTVMKDLGLNSAFDFQSGNGALLGNTPAIAQYGQGGTVNPTLAMAAAGTNPAGFISQKMLGGVMTSVLNALESEGLVRTLAEPNLVAISGKTANMLAGGQYPVPAVSQDGRLGTEYRNFGVSLGFTPTVLSPASIGIEIATEVSTRGENVPFPVGTQTINIPVFNTRRANTTVELPSGGSIVIAGLLQSDFQNLIQGLPGLKDVPILGKLAGSSAFQRGESELVIAITAYLVEPTDAAKTTLPTDGLLPPSDADLYVLNRLSGMYGKKPKAPPAGVERNFGYITE